MKVCSDGPGHMTKMATMVKTFKNLVLQNRMAKIIETWYIYQVCLNDDPKLTFDLFTQRSILISYAFGWGKVDYSETIGVHENKLVYYIDNLISTWRYTCTRGKVIL